MSALLKGIRSLLLSLLFIIPASLFIIQPAYAQTLPSTTMPIPANVEPTSPIYTDLFVYNLFHTFSCIAIGSSFIGQPCVAYQISKNAQGAIQGVPVLSSANLNGGLLGASSGLIAGLFVNPPVRTSDYMATIGEDFGIKPVHAQVTGSGSDVLSPIIKLWTVSRNVTYIIMIVIFLIIGLMVMFRQRVNPQTVITAQAALPGLVIGLILITFSYFMAGLISDMAFVGTNVVGAYFSAVRGDSNPQNLVNDLNDNKANVISTFSDFAAVADKDRVSNIVSSVWDHLNNNIKGLLTLLAGFISAQLTGQGTELLKAIPTFGAPIQSGIQLIAFGIAANNPTAIVGIALAFIATAILVYTMFKLLLRLINAYLTIIFLTVSAPFQFLAASLPGRQGIATGWILNMLGNILIFPAVLAVFYFVAFLLAPMNPPFKAPAPFKTSDAGAVNSFPTAYAADKTPIVGNSTFPLFGGLDLNFIQMLLAIGALMALPAIPDLIVRTVGRAGQAGQIIGQEVSGNVGAGRGYATQFQQGVGTASGRLAEGRSLFATPAYEAEVDAQGNVTGFRKSKWSYQPGGIQKLRSYIKGGSKFSGEEPPPGSHGPMKV